MSIYVSSEVWAYCDQAGHRLLLMLALADWSNDEGFCWPSQKSIAQRLRCTERGASKMIDALIAEGEIELLSTGNGRGKNAKYRLPKYIRKDERRDRKRMNAVPLKGERGAIPIREPSVEPSNDPPLFNFDRMLPPPINTTEHLIAFSEWIQQLREKRGKKNPLTPTAERKQIMQLIKMGPERALAALEFSARSGYAGLFEPRDQGGKREVKQQQGKITKENAL